MIFPKREHWASQDWTWWGTQLNEVATNNQVVVANVLKKRVDCWLKEVDKKEKWKVQKELAGRENEKCESGSVCVSAPPEPTNPQYVSVSHMKMRWVRHRQNTKHTSTQWLSWMHWNSTRPRLFSVQDNRSRTHKQRRQRRKSEGGERDSAGCCTD